MTHEEFSQWLTNAAEEYKILGAKPHKSRGYRYEARGMGRAFEECLQKFKALLPPPTTLN